MNDTLPAPSPDLSEEPTVEVLTASDAEGRQRRAAGALASAGLVAGDRVAFCLPSSAALLCAVLGALRTGVIPVLLNATLLDEEQNALIRDADPKLAVTRADDLAVLDAGPPVELTRYPRCRPMHYTSGTTGRSKGVWSGLWDAATAQAAFADEADLWSFGPEDVHLVCSPMHHSVSVRFAGGTLLSGGTCVILRHFDAGGALDALMGGAGAIPTTTFMAPTALARLLALGPALPERFDALRLLVHAGSPCPQAVKRAALDRLRAGVLWEFYGATEGQFTVCSPEEWHERLGSVGRARPGRTLSVDQDGIVWCRPPGFASFEYWRDEAKTASAWRNGSFTVGDLGRLDADGYLYLDGRRDDLIISGGVNVYPAEVEDILSEVRGVAAVAVFGVDDDTWGQRVCAAVVPHPAAVGEAGEGLIGDLSSHAISRLAGYKRPKQYFVVEMLPTTATGKLQRHRVAAQVGMPPARR
ncbi:MAG: class I adenylate-forming enzyme family protein [Acidimicrobiales bacterium]